MVAEPGYRHTQKGWWHWVVVLGLAAVWAVVVLADPHAPGLAAGLAVSAALAALVGGSFAYLRVQDEGDRLGIHYGPLPLFRKHLRYDRLEDVRVARSRWIDGWGIHWVLGRGWTYNLRGFDCVEVRIDGRTIRIGTDEPDCLAAFLRSRMPTGPQNAGGVAPAPQL